MRTDPPAASLNPADATIRPTDILTITASTLSRRGVRLLPLSELPSCGLCECGLKMIGLDVEFLHEALGSALWVVGYCTSGCGEQRSMYLSEPRRTEDEHHASIQREAAAMIAELVARCEALRTAEPE